MKKPETPPETAGWMHNNAGRVRADDESYVVDDAAPALPFAERHVRRAPARHVRYDDIPATEPVRTAEAADYIVAPVSLGTSAPELYPASEEPRNGVAPLLAIAFTILFMVALPVLVFVFPP